MKESLYNILIPYKTAFILYKLWDSCFMLSKNSEVLQLFDKHKNVKTKDLPKKMVENKFFIDNDMDELEEIKHRLTQTNQDKYNYQITINTTLDCTFRCWYCYENHSHKMMMDERDINSIKKIIQKKLNEPQIKNIHLSFFGGEPLLGFKAMKHIIEHVEYVVSTVNKTYSMSMTSNAFLLSKTVSDFLSEHNMESIQITIDGNKERHDKVRFLANGNGSYDRILKNIRYALSVGLDIIIRLNVSENTNLDVKRLLRDFEDLNETCKSHICFMVYKVWQSENDVWDVVDTIVAEIKKHGFFCQNYASGFPHMERTCYADKSQHVVINPGGKIYGCTARDFTEENVEGQLLEDGSIVFNNLRSKRLSQSPFNNSECRRCPILPICIGGCKQRMFEQKEKDKCFFRYTEEDKMKYAKRYIMERFS